MSDRKKTYATYEVYTRKGLEDGIAQLDREMRRLTARRDRYARLLDKMPAQGRME